MKRSLSAAGVALLYFASNVALAYSAETNLWTERRSRMAKPIAPLTAALPAEPARISALLDASRPLRRPLEASIASDVAHPAGASRLSAALSSIPASAASVRRVIFAKPGAPKRGAVVLIQDVHLNLEAQENIARTLVALETSATGGQRVVVGVEGAFGKFNFDRFAGLPDADITKAVARYFLAAGRLSASSYVGIAEDAPAFQGVDDAELYAANAAAVSEANALRPGAAKIVSDALRSIADEKRAGLNAGLKRFDDLKSAHQGGALALGTYVERLAAINTGAAPAQVRKFLEAYKIERALDFTKVEQERRRVLEKIVSAATPQELEALVKDSLRYRAGDIGYAAFHRTLSDLAERKGVGLAQTPAFAAYVRYVLLADAIHAEDLFAAVESLEAGAVATLATSDAEHELLRRGDAAQLAKGLIAFSLTPDEWRRYASLRSLSPIPGATAKPFETFYEKADRRSDKIVENILSGAGETELRGLVAGGFHTPVIAARLAERGADVAIVQPALTKLDGVSGTEYLSIFAREKAPIELLMAGEKLFLAPNQLSVGDPASAAARPNEELLVHYDLASAAAAGKTGRFASGTSAVRREGGSRVIETTSGGRTLTSTPDAVPGSYNAVESGLPAPDPALGLPVLRFISPARALAGARSLLARLTSLIDTKGIGRKYFGWMGAKQPVFTMYVLAPLLEVLAVFNSDFVPAHRGTAEQRARQDRGKAAIVLWTKAGALIGGALALAALIYFAPGLAPRTVAGLLQAVTVGATMVAVVAAAGAVSLNSGRHFFFTLFNPNAALTINGPGIGQAPEVRRVVGGLQHWVLNAFAGSISYIDLLEAGDGSREYNQEILGYLREGVPNFLRALDAFDAARNQNMAFYLGRYDTTGIYITADTPGYQPEDLGGLLSTTGASLNDIAALSSIERQIQSFRVAAEQLIKDASGNDGVLTPGMVGNIRGRSAEMRDGINRLIRNLELRADYIDTRAAAAPPTAGQINDRQRISRLISHELGNRISLVTTNLIGSMVGDTQEKIATRSERALQKIEIFRAFVEYFRPTPDNTSTFYSIDSDPFQLFATPDTAVYGPQITPDMPGISSAEMSRRVDTADVYRMLRELATRLEILARSTQRKTSLTEDDVLQVNVTVTSVINGFHSMTEDFDHITQLMQEDFGSIALSLSQAPTPNTDIRGAPLTTPNTVLTGRLYFSWLGRFLPTFTRLVLAPALEMFAVFRKDFLGLHPGTEAQSARRSRGINLITNAALIGTVVGVVAGIALGVYFAPNTLPLSMDELVLAIAKGVLIVASATAVGFSASNAGTHFIFNLRNPDASLTLSLDEVTPVERIEPALRTTGDARYIRNRQVKERYLQSVHDTQPLIAPGFSDFQSYRDLYAEVRTIYDDLLRVAGLDPAQYQIFIEDASDPNASNVRDYPVISVNLGLIRMLARGNVLTKDAIAFVLAHEITHAIQLRDAVDRNEEEKDLNYFERHQQARAREWEADLGALVLMDRAGYTVGEASRFFRQLAEWIRSHNVKEPAWGTHPELLERAVRLERRVLGRHWLSYDVPTRVFNVAARREIEGSTRLRQIQDRAVHINNVQQLTDLMNEIDDPQLLMFVYMIGANALDRRSGPKVQDDTLKLAFEARLDSLSGTRVEKLQRRLLEKLIADSLDRREYRRVGYDLKIDEEYAREVRGLSQSEQVEMLALGFPRLLEYRIDFDQPDSAQQAAQEFLDWIHVAKDEETYKNVYRTVGDGNRSRTYMDGIGDSMIAGLEADIAAGQMPVDDTFRLLQILSALRDRALNNGFGSRYEAYITRVTGALMKRRSTAQELSEAQLDVLIDFIKEGLTPAIDAGNWYKASPGHPLGLDAAELIVEYVRAAPPALQARFRARVAAEGADWATINASYRTPEFAALGQAARLDYVRLMVRGRYEGSEDWSFPVAEFMKYFDGKLSEEDTEMLYRTALEEFGRAGWARGDRFREEFDKRIGTDPGFFNGDAYDRSLPAAVGPEVAGRLPNVRREMKPLLYVLAHGGGSWDVVKVAMQGMNNDERQVLGALLRRSSKRLGEAVRKTSPYFSLSHDDDNDRDIAFAMGSVPIFLMNLFDDLGLPAPITFDDAIQAWDFKGTNRWDAFQNEVRSGGGDMLSVESNPSRVRRMSPAEPMSEPGSVRALLSVISQIPGTPEEAAARVTAAFPATALRNHLLFFLWIDRVLEPALGQRVPDTELQDLEALQARVAGLAPADRARVLAALQTIIPSMADDYFVRSGNDLNWTRMTTQLSLPVDEAPLRAAHATEVASYGEALYTSRGGTASQLDVFMASLATPALVEEMSRPGRMVEKTELILTYFNRPSAERDYWIVQALDGRVTANSVLGVQALLELFSNNSLRDKYALEMLDQVWTQSPDLFADLDSALPVVIRFFPDASALRDDVLNEVAQRAARIPEDMKRVEALMGNPFESPERLREKETQKTAFLTDLIRQMIVARDPIEKARFLLWLYDSPGSANPRPKPYFLIVLEHKFHVNFDTLRTVLLPTVTANIPDAGRSGYKEFLSAILNGRDNIFSDGDSTKLFLDGLFDSMIPATSTKRDFLRVVFNAVFRYADDFRREEIIVNLTLAMSSLNQANGSLSPEVREARAIRLMLEALGLVGVKISQILARSPSTPAVQREEFEKSESGARPLPKGIVFDLIAKLGLSSRILSVEEPLGSASIKVVYRVRIRFPIIGERIVAFKVKRPDVEKRIVDDLRFTENVLTAIGPELVGFGFVIPKRLIQQIKEIFTSELDFQGERSNADRLRSSLDNKGIIARVRNFFLSIPLRFAFPSVAWGRYRFTVPRIFEVIDNKIIIEELVQGTPLSQGGKLAAQGYNVQDLRRRAAREFFRQLFVDGFYHADPKIGHVIVDGRTIHLIDAGASSSISAESQAWLVKMVKALKSRNEAAVLGLVPVNGGIPDTLKDQLRQRVINSQESDIARAMWFFQTMEDFDRNLPSDLWAVFRFLAAGGNLFEKDAPAPQPAASLILPSTFSEVLGFFSRHLFLGRAAEWKVSLYTAVRESIAVYGRAFAANHPNVSRAQYLWRLAGQAAIIASSIAGVVLFLAFSGTEPGTVWNIVGLGVSGWSANALIHFLIDAAPQAAGRSALTPAQQTALALVRARDGLPADQQALIDGLVQVLPATAELGLGDGLDLRVQGALYLQDQMRRGRRASNVLPELVALTRANPADVKAYDDVVRPAATPADSTVNVRVVAEGTSAAAIEAEARKELARRSAAGSKETLVFAISGKDATAVASLALDGKFGKAVRFVANDDTLAFAPDALQARLELSALKKINVFLSQNAALSPAAMESLQALERLNPRLASIYLLIESATRIAVPVTTTQLGDMIRLRRLIETQA